MEKIEFFDYPKIAREMKIPAIVLKGIESQRLATEAEVIPSLNPTDLLEANNLLQTTDKKQTRKRH